MARPTTRDELLSGAQARYQALMDTIRGLDAQALSAPFDFPATPAFKEAHWQRDKNLRDVLIHLYEWHQLWLSWAAANMQGEPRPFLPPPYSWKSYGDMNVMIWQRHQATTLEQAKALLDQSHAQALALISGFTNEQLFTKGALPWTGGSTLGSYCASATSSHYDWAIKKLKAHARRCGEG